MCTRLMIFSSSGQRHAASWFCMKTIMFSSEPDRLDKRYFNQRRCPLSTCPTICIGVAIADNPYGPFKPEPTSIQGIRGIDPGVIIDKDGSAYLFYSDLMVAKLKENMVEIEGRPQQIANLPKKGLREGPFPFERNGIYYLTYPHVQNNTERLEYATASSPMGPYEWKSVIMDESASGCWTNLSLLNTKGSGTCSIMTWLSPFDKNRAIKADYLYFNEDGTIQKVIPTVRGIGNARQPTRFKSTVTAPRRGRHW